ncbi:MAG: hypothetical protein NVS1B13_20230 [Flavisolibacter sp.]
MKNILIAAAIVGAATAGAILFMQNNLQGGKSNKIKGAAKNAYDTMNAGIGKIERSGQHSMG